MDELGIFPESNLEKTKALITHFDEKGFEYGLQILHKMRSAGIPSELFPETGKIKKQLTYADKKQIPFVIILGDNEIQEGKVSLKNLNSGTQETVSIDRAIEILINS